MLVLGIETSCDETAAAVVKNGREVLSSDVSSSLDLHRFYGGVIPEIACRVHTEVISFVVDRALKKAGVGLDKIGLVAVTVGPGLVGALLVGISFAKALSFTRKIPIVGINHLEAHLFAHFLEKRLSGFPYIGMVVSGGHTILVCVKDNFSYRLLGSTRDDAGGEAFDKVAKILGLGYPGGPEIDRLSRRGDPGRIAFPRSYLEPGSLDFSFSGLKTAVLYFVNRHPEIRRNGSSITVGKGGETVTVYDVAAAFQDAVVDVLVEKAVRACAFKKIRRLVVGGGVSVNSRLRSRLKTEARKRKISVFFPETRFCLDNAAMVAGLGYRRYKKFGPDHLSITAAPNLGIG